jgi:hypothetical protein
MAEDINDKDGQVALTPTNGGRQEVINNDPLTESCKLLRKVQPQLLRELEHFPDGFQIDVNAPEFEIKSVEEYGRAMGKNLDSLGAGLLGLGVGKLLVAPRLGLLNITSVGPETSTLEYHPLQEGARRFTISFQDEKLSLDGVKPEEAYYALSTFFTPDGQYQRNTRKIHLSTIRNLAIFNSDGTTRKE